jgi:hypothetical protein
MSKILGATVHNLVSRVPTQFDIRLIFIGIENMFYANVALSSKEAC